MVNLNRSRLDYVEKFEQMIEEYNSGSKNIEEFFRSLRVFVQELDEEDQRSMREELSEEELALFDILTKPEMDLTAKDKAAVKKVARALLERLKSEKLVLDWRNPNSCRLAATASTAESLIRGLLS
jgi:type I restriction enzyme R subunit